VVVIVPMVAGALARLDAFGGDHDRRFGAGGLDQPLEPAFEAEPVHEDELGIGDLLGIARRGRIDVGIAVGTDQSLDRDSVAADVFHEITEDREGRNHVESLLRARGSGDKQRGESRRRKQASSGQHGILLYGRNGHASRWRPGNSCRTRPPTWPNSSEAT
jgi:hypothetical protein